MTRSIFVLATAAAFVLTSGTVSAQRGQGGTKAPKVKIAQPSHASASQGPKVKSSPAATTKTHGPKTTTTKTHGKSAATTTASGTRAKGADSGRPTTTTTSSTATSSTTTATDGTTLTLSPVQQKLQKNTQLASKLEGRLPAGTNLMDAAEGFPNLGLFVAAVNVSNNLGIQFVDLKSRMVDDGMSLGQAIQAERHDVDNVTLVVRQAERDAQVIIADADADGATKTKKKDADAPKTPKPRKGGGQ